MAGASTTSGFQPVRVGLMHFMNIPKRQLYSTNQGSYGMEMGGILHFKMGPYLSLERMLLSKPFEIATATRSRSAGAMAPGETLLRSPRQMDAGFSSPVIRVVVSPRPRTIAVERLATSMTRVDGCGRLRMPMAV